MPRPITAEDLFRFQLLSGTAVSPDGSMAAYTLTRTDKTSQKRYSNIWVVDLATGRRRQFTRGDQVDRSPAWAPDGKHLAFVSCRDAGSSEGPGQEQIYLIPVDGGEARKLTSLEGRIHCFDFSPDSRSILVLLTKKDAEQKELEKDEKKRKLGIVSRRIERLFFKLDGMGYRPKELPHIWLVNAGSGKAGQITDSPVHSESGPPCWSPDSKRIAFTSNVSKDPDLDPSAIDLFVMKADGTGRKRLKTPEGPKFEPSFSPDGKRLAWLGMEGKGQGWRLTRLWVAPASGSGEAVCLSRDFDINITAWTINDLPEGLGETAPVWSPDGGSIYVQIAHHGATRLARFSSDPDRPSMEEVISGDLVVGHPVFDGARKKVVYAEGSMGNPGRLRLRNLAKGSDRDLADPNRWLRSSIDLGMVEEAWIDGPDGNRIQGWIMKPPGFSPRRKYPSILEIHGGPRVQYGHFFMHEFYFLAAAGYVVHFCNPRGGQGYGEQHSKAILDNWGTVDYDDLMAWTDHLAEKKYIDPGRMGVTGGSYGGYMTCWIVGHTDRFRAAVTQRCVSNLISMYGSSDFNWSFQREFGDKPPWESLENYWRQSPIAFVGNVKTPTMVIHSESDLRCAIEQGEQFYVALKKLGVPTEMIRFPDEPHGLSRGGRTDRRIDRLKHIQRWFDTWLKA
ncbi:S9 family peptidase [Candidatus Fermentibacterales bacterium]|nr:S9 family peptidase [Candidatus Fermentibacterales bacterium]